VLELDHFEDCADARRAQFFLSTSSWNELTIAQTGLTVAQLSVCHSEARCAPKNLSVGAFEIQE
jgi:hypothetical protein